MTEQKMYVIFVLVLIFLFSLSNVNADLLVAEQKADQSELERFFALIEEEKPELIALGASRPLEKEKMPATVTVITAEEIKLLGLRHLTDVINYMVPGGIGDIHRSTRTGLYAFRGITADNNGKFIFMVDGVDVTSKTTWGAFNERYLGLLDELDRIEITQGVGSTLYGSGAISGVINFITKTGKDFQGVEITSGYGSWHKFEETVKYGKKNSEDEHDFYYFGFKRSHGSVPRGGGGDSTVDLTPYGNENFADKNQSASGREWDHFAPSYKFHANIQRGDFTLRARYIQGKFEEPYFASPGKTGNETEYWDTSDTYWFHNYFFIQPEIQHKFNERHSIKANLAVIMEEMGREKLRNWHARPDEGGALIAGQGDRVETAGEKKLRGQFFHYYDGWENHRITSGIDLFWMHVGADLRGENKKIIDDSGTRVTRTYHKSDNFYFVGAFVEDIWQINDKTILFAGVRIENENRTPTSITPRFAISHELSEKTNIKLLYNTGYRTPAPTYYIEGKPDPDPEKVQSWEAHILHKWNDKFSTSLIGYYTIYKDLINFWSSSFGGPSTQYNFPEVKASGLELTADYHTDNLKFKFGHSYSRPVHFADSEHAYNATFLSYNLRDWAQFPTHMTKASAVINLIDDKCILGITYLRPWAIRGQRNIDSKLKNPADYINATLTFKLSKDMEVQVSGYNLTGEDRPWWGAYTYDGVSRAINPHTEYFVRLIWRF
jgi:iron complex outermembrane receptor protein